MPLPPEVVRGLQALELRLGKPVHVRLVRLDHARGPECSLVDRGAFAELRCHDPQPGFFWYLDAIRAYLREEGLLEGA